jgi:hypothetical protein
MESYKKGKTMEELYGVEKAKELKEGLKKRNYTWGYKIGNALRGKHHSEQSKKNMSLGRMGMKLSEECKKKMRESAIKGPTPWRFKKGHIPNNLDILHSEITRRKISASHQGIPLEKWEKYTHREPYSQNWDSMFKNIIRKRDNQVCMNCGKHREKLNRALDVHHINYNKKLSILQNCISLCRKCHTLTNGNRPHWIKFFQSLLSERYGYQYDENQTIILNLEQTSK